MKAPLRAPLVAAACALVTLVGCSSIPEGGAPVVQSRSDAVKIGRIGIAPIDSGQITVAAGETEHWKKEQVFIHTKDRDLQEAVCEALSKTGSYDAVRKATSDDSDESWKEHDDYLVRLTLDNVKIDFDHSGWYVPNLFDFAFWIWPAWLCATEHYTLSFEATLTVLSADSGAVLVAAHKVFSAEQRKAIAEGQAKADTEHSVSVQGTFGDMDRGWRFFGPINGASDDTDCWFSIATQLLPAARRQLAEKVAFDLEDLRTLSTAKAFQDARHKTVALAVGVTSYGDTNVFPRINYASEDAKTLVDSLGTRGIGPGHAVLLQDSSASLAAFKQALTEHLTRGREGDSILVSFAGCGSRDATGAPLLLFADSDGTQGMTLKELAEILSKVPGRKIVLLDTSFDGLNRSIKRGPLPNNAKADLEPFEAAGIAVMTAAEPGQAAVGAEYLGHGLFSHYLTKVLTDNPGQLAADEVFRQVHDRVLAETAYEGDPQSPRGAGLVRFSFDPAIAR